jgi:hypothetical protein
MASAKGRQSGVRGAVSGAVATGLPPPDVCGAGIAAEDFSASEGDTFAVMAVSCDKRRRRDATRREGRRIGLKGTVEEGVRRDAAAP